jgi:RIO kinase 1
MKFIDDVADHEAFDPTYTGGKQERSWLIAALAEFHESRLIKDVLYKVKGGKEATVYCCTRGDGTGLIAAKVYRPEQFREMKNDALYRLGREEMTSEGKAIRDSRAQRAMHKRTRFGRRMRSGSWLAHEFECLEQLHAIGADVPAPLAMGERAILMQFIGDADHAAPTLHEVDLPRSSALAVFERIVANLGLMLSLPRVHGDLSPFNILMEAERPVVIDLPQWINPMTHPAGYQLLSRDVERICRYFIRRGVDADPSNLTAQLWREHLARF